MRSLLEEYLVENGIEVQTNVNDILFSINQLHYVFRSFPDDPYFIQMLLPNVDDSDVAQRREVIADINKRFKVAKIVEIEQKPWIVADSFVYSKENGKLLIGRLIRLLTDVFNEYKKLTDYTNSPNENE